MERKGRRIRQRPSSSGQMTEMVPLERRKTARVALKNSPKEPAFHRVAALRERVYVNATEPRHEAEIESATKNRFDALDLARGFAVALMILSHGVKGLLTFEQMPSWGLVPIHLVTKFSSSLFLLVFGITLSISFLPHVGTPKWPEKRKKLLVRGLVVLFWYKALTILEMSHLFERDQVWAALTYKAFPVYVEILGYYAITLLWIPWVLPFWKSARLAVRLFIPVAFFGLSTLLYNHFGFFGSEILQAILVEHPDHYTWGQLARAPMIFVGLLIGWMIQAAAKTPQPRLLPFAALSATSVALFIAFLAKAEGHLSDSLIAIATNAGKHPPEAEFMLFSLGGAFMILALAVLGGKRLASSLSVLTVIGRNSLQAFVFHIVVLFAFYRYLFDYFHKIEYKFALFLAVLLIFMTAAWVKTIGWVKANS